MILVCAGWLHEVQWVLCTAFWSMDMTGVYACLFEAVCDVTTVPSHLNTSVEHTSGNTWPYVIASYENSVQLHQRWSTKASLAIISVCTILWTILEKLTALFSVCLAKWIEWAFPCQKKKFTVANLHNKRPRDAMLMLSRRMLLDLLANTKTCKDAPAWHKGVWFQAGKWVQRSHVTREKGWGKEKRSERLKETFFL